MDQMNLSRNLTRLRRERHITQEELAAFLGVTKASVSKWENAQSMPDILLLPQLAAFFGVSVDSLIGYETQLSREQIRRFYLELTEKFSKRPFAEVTAEAEALARRYYSCYPLLFQLCILYFNHFMLPEKPEDRQRMVSTIFSWCERITENCTDAGVNSDAAVLRAILKMQQGDAGEAVSILEPLMTDSNRLSAQSNQVLIQACQMCGDLPRARSYAQITLYQSLLQLIEAGRTELSLYEDPARCLETIRRITSVLETFHLEELHPNIAALFYYETAVFYTRDNRLSDALTALSEFEKCIDRLIRTPVLHGDKYFDLLDQWIEQLPLGNAAPRDISFLQQNIEAALSQPAFDKLRDDEAFQQIKNRLTAKNNTRNGDCHA